ncbi:MAG: flavodoxin family protein [Sedimentisphaerales bacterium]|nr:flavodoxin family protein [Sedimentisphaerales bacterium]
MKILGISGSPRPPEVSGVFKLVKIVLQATELDYEIISLRGKNISGCIACLGCVKDNICKVKDDMIDLRDKISEADAYVIGAPNYYMGINALTRAFLERLYQFQHRTGTTLWGKLAVAVGVGGFSGRICCDRIEQFLAYRFVETVAKVAGRGTAPCHTCGYGQNCQVGVLGRVHGEDVKITHGLIPDVTKQPELIASAKQAGRLLKNRLVNDHSSRRAVEKLKKTVMRKLITSA